MADDYGKAPPGVAGGTGGRTLRTSRTPRRCRGRSINRLAALTMSGSCFWTLAVRDRCGIAVTKSVLRRANSALRACLYERVKLPVRL
jgi:hypothetical protein